MNYRWRLPRWTLVSTGLMSLGILAAAWYLASPLVITTQMVEESPFTAGIHILGQGMFSDRDQIHRGSGEAILARLPDGAALLRFESFKVTNGPDLQVFLSREARATTHEEVYNGVYVGKLKASEGAFHYELAAGTDLSQVKSVVVYCVPFRVIFTTAPLASS